MINANYSPQTIFQTLCLSGKYGHEQGAEAKEAEPGSHPPFLSKQNSSLYLLWVVRVTIILWLQILVSFTCWFCFSSFWRLVSSICLSPTFKTIFNFSSYLWHSYLPSLILKLLSQCWFYCDIIINPNLILSSSRAGKGLCSLWGPLSNSHRCLNAWLVLDRQATELISFLGRKHFIWQEP